MHSRRSVLNTLLLTGALAFAPSLALAQDASGGAQAGGTVGGSTAGGSTSGTASATAKDSKKKKSSKKKKKKSKGDKDEDEQQGAQVTTKIDPGTPTDEDGNPSIVIDPGPTAQGPGDTVGGGAGGGVPTPPAVPPPRPVSPML